MSTERISIQDFLQRSDGQLIIDVRSPSEYYHAHLPGAVNLPLFSDEERAVVGTAYKQKSREEAIKIGLQLFGPKMRKMVEEVEQMYDERCTTCDVPPNTDSLQPKSKIVYLYCWRGGMRSGAVAWLLSMYGFHVTVLNGGYKSFRNWALEKLAYPYHFRIIGGFTGSGKTELLKELGEKGELVIDLEELAVHKGSAFGNIGMTSQPTQEMFENRLALELWDKYQIGKQRTTPEEIAEGLTLHPQQPIWLEDESQRIGLLNIPASLWQTMRNAPITFLDIPFEERLEHLVQEYGALDRQRMIEAIQRISKRLGPLQSKTAIELLQEGNVRRCFSILLTYYDKHYLRGLHNRHNVTSLLTRVSCSTVHTCNAFLLLNQPLLS